MTHTLRTASALATAALAVGFLSTPGIASADAGSWWYDTIGVPAAHAEGLTGEGVSIAVIDSQINPEVPVLAEATLEMQEESYCTGDSPVSTVPDQGTEHGTAVVSYLVGNGDRGPSGIAPDASIRFFSNGQATTPENWLELARLCAAHAKEKEGEASDFGITGAIYDAVDEGADIISISMGSPGLEGALMRFDLDSRAIAYAMVHDVIVVAAVGNSTEDSTNHFPAAYNGVVGVTAIDAEGRLLEDSAQPGQEVVFPEATIAAPGVGFSTPDWGDGPSLTAGSSNAAPLVAGALALARQKYPEATANQLIQSLISTATPGGKEGFGHGILSLDGLLATDPSRFPDENPLMDKQSEAPTVDEVKVVATGQCGRSSFATYECEDILAEIKAGDRPDPSSAAGASEAPSAGAGGNTSALSGADPADPVPLVGLILGGIGALLTITLVVLIVILLRTRSRP